MARSKITFCQAVSRRLPTAAARVPALIRSCGFWVGEVALGKFFCEYIGLPYQFSFHGLLSMSSGAGTVGPLVSRSTRKKNTFNFTTLYPVLKNFQSLQNGSKMHYLKVLAYKVDDARNVSLFKRQYKINCEQRAQ
jgi:hypothetical protein